MSRTELTPRQARFVEEYLIDLNATQAAARAGYSKQTANEQGARLLANASVSAAIHEAQAARSGRTEITQDRVLTEYAKLGFANMADFTRIQDDGSAYTDLSMVTRDQMAAIQEITVYEYTDGKGEAARPVRRVKVKLADKKAALDSIARHLGMFVERLEATHFHDLAARVAAARKRTEKSGNGEARNNETP